MESKAVELKTILTAAQYMVKLIACVIVCLKLIAALNTLLLIVGCLLAYKFSWWLLILAGVCLIGIAVVCFAWHKAAGTLEALVMMCNILNVLLTTNPEERARCLQKHLIRELEKSVNERAQLLEDAATQKFTQIEGQAQLQAQLLEDRLENKAQEVSHFVEGNLNFVDGKLNEMRLTFENFQLVMLDLCIKYPSLSDDMRRTAEDNIRSFIVRLLLDAVKKQLMFSFGVSVFLLPIVLAASGVGGLLIPAISAAAHYKISSEVQTTTDVLGAVCVALGGVGLCASMCLYFVVSASLTKVFDSLEKILTTDNCNG